MVSSRFRVGWRTYLDDDVERAGDVLGSQEVRGAMPGDEQQVGLDDVELCEHRPAAP